MSASEQVYALLIEANPVPDPDALSSTHRTPAADLHVLDPGRIQMQTQEKVKPVAPKEPTQKRWFPAVAAAAAVIAIGVAIVLLSAESDEPGPVVDSPAPAVTAPETDPVSERQSAAVAKAERFHLALIAGDVDEMVALAQADEADRLMFEHNVAVAAEYPFDVTGCVAAETTDELVAVDCTFVMSDPVFVAFGATEIVSPWWVYDDGRMAWLEYEGVDPIELNTAYRDYLLLNDPAAYAEVCDPSKFTFGTVNFGGGMAFTPECAQLQLSVAEDVAAWIEAGQPGS